MLFPRSALVQFCIDAEPHQGQVAHTYITGASHSSFRPFFFQQQQKLRKTSHGNEKLFWGGDRADGSQQPTATTSCGMSQITALKLHQWRTTTQSCILLFAPDPFIPGKPLHECYTYTSLEQVYKEKKKTPLKTKILGERSSRVGGEATGHCDVQLSLLPSPRKPTSSGQPPSARPSQANRDQCDGLTWDMFSWRQGKSIKPTTSDSTVWN